MIRQNFDLTSAITYGSYGCSVTNRTRFYLLRTYGTFVTGRYGSTGTESTVRYGFLRYVTLRECGKQA